jgi:hypothetical protein
VCLLGAVAQTSLNSGQHMRYVLTSHTHAQALWFSFTPNPKVADPASWRMHKIQRPVDPLDVVRNGSQSLHAVTDEGVTVNGVGANSWEQLQILCGPPIC